MKNVLHSVICLTLILFIVLVKFNVLYCANIVCYSGSYKLQYTLKTVKHGGAKINIWARFPYYDVGPIFKIDGIMDQNIYLEILRNTMLYYAEEDILKWVYMQVKDPKHTSCRVKSCFMEMRIVVMEPARSPDLNPIGKPSDECKRAVYEKPKNQQEL